MRGARLRKYHASITRASGGASCAPLCARRLCACWGLSSALLSWRRPSDPRSCDATRPDLPDERARRATRRRVPRARARDAPPARGAASSCDERAIHDRARSRARRCDASRAWLLRAWAAEDRRPSGAPSRGRSRSPAESIARRACLRARGEFPRGRTRPLAWTRSFPGPCRAARAASFFWRACGPSLHHSFHCALKPVSTVGGSCSPPLHVSSKLPATNICAPPLDVAATVSHVTMV